MGLGSKNVNKIKAAQDKRHQRAFRLNEVELRVL
jgi:hypothetical protein